MAEQQPRVLVVDDEPAVQTALSRALKLERYEVAQAADGREALERLGAMAYEVVILDVSMPHVDGLEVCRQLRTGGDRTPVLMLTAREGVDDRVAGLDAGADDYLVKPFALRELLARVRALLRRAGEDDDQDSTLTFEDLRLDRLAHEAWRGERMLPLTRTEFLLLEMFLRHPRQVLTRSAIFEDVWGYDFGATSNSLGVYMGYLRRKTEAGDEPRLLHTVRGVGYVLRGCLVSFRRRITFVSAAAVAVAVVLASLLTYLLTSHQLHSQVDSQLNSRADSLTFIARNPSRRSRGSLLDLIKGQDADQGSARDGATTAQGVSNRWATCRRDPARCAATSSSSTAMATILFRSLRQRHAAGRRPHAGAGALRG